jgi:hypothetical protein
MGADGASLGRGPRARAMNGPRRPVLSLPRCMAALLTFCRQHLLEAFWFRCIAGPRATQALGRSRCIGRALEGLFSVSVPTPWSAGTQAFGPTCHDSCIWDKREIASNQLSEAPRFGLNLGARRRPA